MKARHIFYMILMTGCLLANLSACTFASKTTETERQIKVPAPLRPAGQTDVVGLACEPIETVRIGFIGLGARGTEAIRRFTYQTSNPQLSSSASFLRLNVLSSLN